MTARVQAIAWTVTLGAAWPVLVWLGLEMGS